jgi:hypothetical protein
MVKIRSCEDISDRNEAAGALRWSHPLKRTAALTHRPLGSRHSATGQIEPPDERPGSGLAVSERTVANPPISDSRFAKIKQSV